MVKWRLEVCLVAKVMAGDGGLNRKLFSGYVTSGDDVILVWLKEIWRMLLIPLLKLVSYLATNQIVFLITCVLLGNGRLAILLSQALGNVTYRMAINKQLAEWENMKIDEHISDVIIKIYLLLAGRPVSAL